MSNESKSSLKPVKSSLITAYSYNHEDSTLDVVFKDGTERTYKNVTPAEMSQVFDSSASIGKAFHKLIGRSHKWEPTES